MDSELKTVLQHLSGCNPYLAVIQTNFFSQESRYSECKVQYNMLTLLCKQVIKFQVRHTLLLRNYWSSCYHLSQTLSKPT